MLPRVPDVVADRVRVTDPPGLTAALRDAADPASLYISPLVKADIELVDCLPPWVSRIAPHPYVSAESIAWLQARLALDMVPDAPIYHKGDS